MVLSKSGVKYLGIVVDTKMGVFEQIHNTADKAAVRIFAICQLMSEASYLSMADFLSNEMYHKCLAQVQELVSFESFSPVVPSPSQ